MAIYLTSDTHFSHHNILKYCSRPFQSVGEMDEALIRNWNSQVKEDDEIFHLGDFTFERDPTKVLQIIRRLSGIKFFIKGNHDKVMDDPQIKSCFQWYKEYFELRVPQRPMAVLCHYPLLTWNKAHKGSLMLHGHCHGAVNNLNQNTTRMDIGVDSQDYMPISLGEVIKKLSKINYQPVDYHGRKNE